MLLYFILNLPFSSSCSVGEFNFSGLFIRNLLCEEAQIVMSISHLHLSITLLVDLLLFLTLQYEHL